MATISSEGPRGLCPLHKRACGSVPRGRVVLPATRQTSGMKSTDNDAVGGLEPSNSTATLRNRGNRDTLEAAVKGLHSGFRSLRDEMDFWVGEDMIEGEIPKDISGTLFRNGPGMFTYGSQRTNAFFDGDGMVVKLSFAKGRVHFRNAYVRTPEFLEEQRAGRFIHRSVFSTGNPTGGIFFNPLDFTFKNPANTAVLLWNDCLYALNEAGLPVAMCPRSLRTLASGVTSFGPDRFAGDIRTEFFAAHHRILRTSCGGSRLVGMGTSTNSVQNSMLLEFIEVGETGNMVHRTPYDIKGALLGFFHDFSVTDNYYVVVENPTRLDFAKMMTQYMFGLKSLGECIEFVSDQPARVHLLPRPGSHPSAKRHVVDIENCFVFHHLNAYEVTRPDGAPGHLVLDVLPMPSVDFSKTNDDINMERYRDADNKAQLWRYAIDMRSGGATVQRAKLAENWSEMPTVAPGFHGRPHTSAYVERSRFDGPGIFGPPQMVTRVRMDPDAGVSRPVSEAIVEADSWDAGTGRIVGEPVFIPRDGAAPDTEDDGYVVSVVHNWWEENCEIVILNARRMSDGPVATLKLPFIVPFGLHGSWFSASLAPDERGEGEGKIHVFNRIKG